MTSFARKVIFIATMLAFVSIAVFGAFDTLASSDASMQGCLATSLNGFSCPSAPGTLSFFSFHVKAFTDFSSGALSFASVLLVLIAAFVAFTAAVFALTFARRPVFAYQRTRSNAYVPIHKHTSASWLSLLEHSPSSR